MFTNQLKPVKSPPAHFHPQNTYICPTQSKKLHNHLLFIRESHNKPLLPKRYNNTLQPRKTFTDPLPFKKAMLITHCNLGKPRKTHYYP